MPLSDVQLGIAEQVGYASTPNAGSQTVFFAERGSEQFEDSHLFDLALNYQIPVWRTLRPYVEFEMFNIFNQTPLIDFNTTITPNFDGPLDELGLPLTFTRGPRFGEATTEGDFPRGADVPDVGGLPVPTGLDCASLSPGARGISRALFPNRRIRQSAHPVHRL